MAIVKITQTKSRIGATKTQRANLDALGLRKIRQSVEHNKCPEIMGMVEKVKHLVHVEEVK
ncbi:50S ribosomal protein L30 [uncultured Rikenella sp.]|uniref:50S ribosomal protein L30 n=1 Tax=uncultured Rikenella sp. TaxID=368003 RepID=UPI0025D665EF|nr:50S ribosomal protein L30 [uncultured Rikenella sp.]